MAAFFFRGQLGQFLVEKGWITRAQLEQALEEQRRSGRRLGEILLSQGLLSRRQLQTALAAQLGVRAWDLRAAPPEPAVARSVPDWVARRYQLLPVRQEGSRLVVAMADPTDLEALEEVRLLTGQEVEPVLGDEEDLREAIGRIFGLLETAERATRTAAAQRLRPGGRGPGGRGGDGAARNGGPEAGRPGAEAEEAEPVPPEGQAPVVEFVQNLLEQAVREKASDIHLEPGETSFAIRFRIDGALHLAMNPPLALHAAVVSRLKVLAGMDIAERRLPQDGRFSVVVEGREYDCRCSSMPTVHGEKMVIRLLDKQGGGARLDALGLPPDVVERLRELIRRPYGMILLTGPTGSGKSTTLAALLQEVDRNRLNVVTIEDPVEYEIPGVNQSQVNVRAGLTFGLALRHFLRQDPDVIMVGEIRDRETADTAVRAALTGHLLLSTLHTNDAPTSVTRLEEMGVEPFLIASSLLAVAAQRLVRVLCPHCRQPYAAGEPAAELFAQAGIELDPGASLYRPQGCSSCRNGYTGRTAIAELMVVSPELRERIGARASADELRRLAVAEGMRPLRQAGLELARQGVTSVEEVLRVTEAAAAPDPARPHGGEPEPR
ncbi:MAG: ATPase, T2SS/T4P/T4SS family [Bacillota bacterium]|nr:ATPase, T2SS/T4P/T4SS family [Bacillota bacterium]